MTNASVLKTLKTKTRDWHTKTEAVAYVEAIKTKTLTLSQYADLLQKNDYIHRQLERAFLQNTWQYYNNSKLATFFHSRLPTLQKDLALADVRTKDFLATYQPTYTIPAQLIGHLYVVEGSSMGGRIIANALSKIEVFSMVQPFHFFNQIGQASLRERWIQLNDLAERHIKSEEELEMASATAIDVFRFFHAVYKQKA